MKTSIFMLVLILSSCIGMKEPINRHYIIYYTEFGYGPMGGKEVIYYAEVINKTITAWNKTYITQGRPNIYQKDEFQCGKWNMDPIEPGECNIESYKNDLVKVALNTPDYVNRIMNIEGITEHEDKSWSDGCKTLGPSELTVCKKDGEVTKYETMPYRGGLAWEKKYVTKDQ